MKKIMLVLAFIFSILIAKSQDLFPYDSIAGEVIYTEIKETLLNKEKLFSNAKLWVATNLNDFNKTIKLEDLYSGKIIVHYDKSMNNYSNTFDVLIELKDNKFRYKIYNIKYEAIINGKYTLYRMIDYRNNYFNETYEAARKFALELNNRYSEIGLSIVNAMIKIDDF